MQLILLFAVGLQELVKPFPHAFMPAKTWNLEKEQYAREK